MTYYETNPQRLPFLGHCSFGVRDMTKSKPFYTAIFKTFGVEIVYDDPSGKLVGYGWGDMEPFTLFERKEAAPHGVGTHLAFNAPSRKAVDEFYAAALANGGRGDGVPGVRTEIHANYYPCFVFDPDGHRLEAVFQQPEEEGESK